MSEGATATAAAAAAAAERTPLQELAAFAVATRAAGLPPELVHDVKRRVLDVVGNSLGAVSYEPARIALQVARAWGGAGQATAIGSGARLPATAAALVNGTLAHTLDFDDTHLPSVLHPSASVIPAALAVAEAEGRSGLEAIVASAIGIELNVRLGSAGFDAATNVNLFFEHGLHATSICGALAAAATAATLMGLDEEGIGHAIAIACSMGAGLLEANRTGGTVKRIHCGWAAHSGIAAAELARAGLTGPLTVMEGRFGFLQATCGERADVGALTRGLGSDWELPKVTFKPYPCNHFTHPGIDAALQLRAEGLDPREIESIVLGAPTSVLRTIGQPPEEKARPQSGYHAAFSGPFTVASALVGGGGLGLYLDDFTDELAREPFRLSLAAKVTCVPDAECDRIFPSRFPARLTVTTTSGELREAFVGSSRGGFESPLSDGELGLKFELNAGRALSSERVAGLRAAVERLDSAADLRKLLSQTAVS